MLSRTSVKEKWDNSAPEISTFQYMVKLNGQSFSSHQYRSTSTGTFTKLQIHLLSRPGLHRACKNKVEARHIDQHLAFGRPHNDAL